MFWQTFTVTCGRPGRLCCWFLFLVVSGRDGDAKDEMFDAPRCSLAPTCPGGTGRVLGKGDACQVAGDRPLEWGQLEQWGGNMGQQSDNMRQMGGIRGLGCRRIVSQVQTKQ